MIDAPLAPGQTERWLAASYDAAARRALNESFCVTLGGNVDVGALKLALQDVLMRHDAFCVRFDLDQPRQSLAPAGPINVTEVDRRDCRDADAALDAFCSEASGRDFALDRAPLAAATLLRLSDGRVVVHIVASHLVFDGWASSVFNAELAVAYRARCDGVAPVFDTAESPLAFAEAEQRRFNGEEGQRSLAYWRQTLRDVPPPLALGDLEPPKPRRYAADTVRAVLGGELFTGLRASAKQSGATLFQLLLTAVAAMLHRQSSQRDFIISVPYASQGLARHGPLLADGVLDLPLKLHCDASDTGATLIGRVRRQMLDALEHPLVTQGTIARALGIASAGDRPTLTGVFFNLNPKVDLSAFAPLVATMHEGRKRGTLHELFFNFYEQADALTLDLHYGADFFSAARAQALVDALRSVCNQLASSIDSPVGHTVDARLHEWNATAVPIEPGARVEQWIARQASAAPDAIAVEARGTTLSYREVESRANRIAHAVRAKGIGSGALVGLCLARGPELIPALLGVLKSGAAYVPLDPSFPIERLREMVQDAGLGLVITESGCADRSGVSREAQLRLDDDAASIASAPDTLPAWQTELNDDAPAYVIYTSGSTGRPKGVVVPQRAVCNFLASMRREPGMRAQNRLLAVTTLSFDIAVLELLLPLVAGARVVIADREDAMEGEALARLIAGHRIDVMQATPTTWHLLLDAGWRAPPGFRVLCGGEALPPSLAAKLLEHGVELWNLYGPTETTVWSTLARIEDARGKIGIGRPIDNTQVWVVDETLRPCAVGTEGEICIGGAGVSIGYHKRSELTAERFIADPFCGGRMYRTGDLGLWRDDGTLEHRGRLDFQVKVRGYRIELGEIEARLAQLPGVSRNIVVAHEHSPGDVALVAYVVTDGAVAASALRDALRASLPDYMLPRHIVAIDRLPLLPNGKVDRKALPAPTSDVPGPSPVAEQGSGLERIVSDAMATVLGRASVSPHDNFFELGGHSLLAARLSAMLSEALGQRPGLRAIFEAPTPAGLAASLTRSRETHGAAAPTDAIAMRADQSTAPLSQMQQRVWFLENLTPGTVVHCIPTGHRFSGPLDVTALDLAFKLLVARQSVLRTVIERREDGDRQRVLADLPFSLLPLHDLSALPEAERKPAMQRDIARLVEVPYDLERGPLFTARLYRLSMEEHGLLFQAHHLIWDAWSFDILYRDLAELYDACRNGREPKLPPITASYGDFAEWHNAWMSGNELARQAKYWRDKLTPLPPPIELPLDRPRPANMSGRGGSHQFNLNAQATQALHEASRRHGRTIYVTLLAAYALLLQRLTGQDDFVVGTPVRGREHSALEPLMGFFVNMLPMRMRFDARHHGRVARERAARGRRVVLVPRRAVRAGRARAATCRGTTAGLRCTRCCSRTRTVREQPTQWGGSRSHDAHPAGDGNAEDLSLWLIERADGVGADLAFSTDVFNPATASS